MYDDAVRALLSPQDAPGAQRCFRALGVEGTLARVVVSSARERPFSARCAVVETPFGHARATVVPPDFEPLPHAGGVGSVQPAALLHTSWAHALIAVRLSSPDYPRIHFDELGILAELVPRIGALAAHPDLVAMERLSTSDQDLLETLIAQPSVRAAAALLGYHHSSVQQRLDSLSERLGFDVRNPGGRFRLSVMVLMARAAQFRFPPMG